MTSFLLSVIVSNYLAYWSGSLVRLLCLVSSPSFLAWLFSLVSSPRFLAWLFSPAFKDNKVISSFSTFLRLLLSFFKVSSEFLRYSPHCFPLLWVTWCSPHRFAGLCASFLFLFSEPLGAFRILPLFSAPLFFAPLLFLLSLFFYSISISHLLFLISPSPSLLLCSLLLLVTWHSLHPSAILWDSWRSPHSFAGLLVPWRSRHLFFFLFSSLVSYSPFFSCSLFFLSHLTFPASFRYSLHLFSFFLFRASWCSLYSFAALPLSSDGFWTMRQTAFPDSCCLCSVIRP